MAAKNDTDANDWQVRAEPDAHDPLRGVLRQVAEALMSAEADAVCNAHWGERRRDRVNSRNGYRTRTWDTQVGSIDIAIPKLRHGTYFPAWLLDPQRRAERELIAAIVEAHGKGVSARRLAALLQSLGMDRLSRSQLWKVTREVDAAVRGMRGAAGTPPPREEADHEDADRDAADREEGNHGQPALGAPDPLDSIHAREVRDDGLRDDVRAPPRSGAEAPAAGPAAAHGAEKRESAPPPEVWTRDTPHAHRG